MALAWAATIGRHGADRAPIVTARCSGSKLRPRRGSFVAVTCSWRNVRGDGTRSRIQRRPRRVTRAHRFLRRAGSDLLGGTTAAAAGPDLRDLAVGDDGH